MLKMVIPDYISTCDQILFSMVPLGMRKIYVGLRG